MSSENNNIYSAEISSLSKVAESYIKQNKWKVRWNNLMKLSIIIFILNFVFMSFNNNPESSLFGLDPYVAIIKLEGPIASNSSAGAEKILPLLKEAFEDSSAKAVIIKANSPGGSPVQSDLINEEIFRLKKLHKKPVYAVVEDVCASGCYYIISAVDKIYANQNSMIGSVGVRMDLFAFTDLMEKVGIENRSMTAGSHKTFINPFGSKDVEGRKFFQKHVLETTHKAFINTIKKGRGKRLKSDPDIFSGLVWLGKESVEKGLIDGLGHTNYVMRDIIKLENSRLFKPETNFIEDIVVSTSTKLMQQASLYLNSMH